MAEQAFINEQVAFIEAVLARGSLDPAATASCTARLDAIRRRHGDPTFRLGVIGEFSSGKSSFINALLGDDLLKTDIVVTTTVATEVVAGERLELDLRFRDSARWLSADGDAAEIRRHVGSAAEGQDVRETLARLTTDPRATTHLSAVRIRHPAALLQDGVALIDTPGLNAAEEGHTDTTLSVLAERADACVIVLRSGQALPLTLSRFLKRDDVRPHLRHAVFVVTQMAAVPPRQQDELLERIRNGLRSTLGLESPVVMPCSVGVVLDHLADPESVRACDLPWVERFAALRRDLDERLRRERASIVSERLLTVLDTLMAQLREHLRDRERELAASRTALKTARAPRLASFAQKERARVYKELETASAGIRRRAEWSAALHRQEAVETCEGVLDAAHGRSALRRAAEQLENLVQVALDAYAADVDGFSGELQEAAASAVASFDGRFKAAYARLTQLGAGPRPKRRRKWSRLTIGRETASAALGHVAISARPQDMGAAMGGIAAGVVAAAFIPVIGPLVGLGAWLLGRTSDEEIRANCMEALEEAADEVFDEAKRAADKHLRKSAKKARERVDQHIDSYLEIFEGTIAEIVAGHEAHGRRLRALSAETTRDVAELARRQHALTERRAAAA
jgi:hypothetical protein